MILCYMIFFLFHMESLEEELSQKIGYVVVLRHCGFGFVLGNKEEIQIEIKLANLWNYFYSLTIL